MKKIIMQKFWFLFMLLSLFLGIMQLSSCRKTFETNPSGALVDSDLQNSEGAAQMVLNGTYRLLRSFEGGGHDNFGIPAICLATDLMSADMARSQSSWFIGFYNYQYSLLETSGRVENYWNRLYRIVANANSVLDQSPQPRQKAQALALRAYAYLWLVNIYANHWKDSSSLMIPLSVKANQSITPASLANTATIYKQIVQDLLGSIEEFGKTNEPRQQKSQIDISVAHGLLARTYLYLGNWQAAIEEASKALGGENSNTQSNFTGNDLMDSGQFKAGFNDIDNSEWMWGLPTNVQQSNIYASSTSMLDPTVQGYAGLGSYICMSSQLYDSMLPSDVRRQVVAGKKKGADGDKFSQSDILTHGSYVQLKFRDPNSSWVAAENFINDRQKAQVVASFTGAFPLMRKAEMYLIAAEACCRKNGSTATCNNGGGCGANTALAKLREKRGSKCNGGGNFNADTAVKERARELWGEGFALVDIKRLKKPMDRSKDSVHLSLTNFNNNVLYVSANSDSLTFLLPRKELVNNPEYNGRQPNNR